MLLKDDVALSYWQPLAYEKVMSRPGDTLYSLFVEIVGKSRFDVLVLREFTSAVIHIPDLLVPGSRYIADQTGPVSEADMAGSLRNLIGRSGATYAEFILVNADARLRPGALRLKSWHVPDDLRKNDAVKVPPSPRLADVAAAWKIDPVTLAVANAKTVLLAAKTTVKVPDGPSVEVRQGDTPDMLARRIAAEYGRTMTVDMLATDPNLTLDSPSSQYMLVPPKALRLSTALTPDLTEVTTPLEVEIVLRRPREQVHPEWPERHPRQPRATGDPVRFPESGLDSFVRSFGNAFSARVALALGRAESGRRQLVAVDLEKAGLAKRDAMWGVPRMFALPPLAVPSRGVHVEVQGLEERTGLPGGAPWWITADTETLERAARHLFATLERCISPDFAGATHRYNSEAYNELLKAKRLLADALAGTLVEVHGDEEPASALNSARERFRQELLADLTQAHTLELLLQVPVSVSSTFDPRVDKPRKRIESGKTGNGGERLVIPAGQSVGWEELKDAWGAQVPVIATLLADIPDLLKSGAKVTCDDHSIMVEPGMTLRQLLVRLGGPVPGALTLSDLTAPEGLFKGSQPVPLIRKEVSIAHGDHFNRLALAADVPLAVLVLNLKAIKGIVNEKDQRFAEAARALPGKGRRASLDHWAAKTGHASAYHFAAANADQAILQPATAPVFVLRHDRCDLADLAQGKAAQEDLVRLLADVPGLLLPNGVATWNNASVRLTRHMTLRQLSVRLGMPKTAELAEDLKTPYGLFNPGLPLPVVEDDGKLVAIRPVPRVAGRVGLAADMAVSKAASPGFGAVKFSLGNGIGTLDIPVRQAAPTKAGTAEPHLTLTLDQLEYDISAVDDRLGYEASHWLHFLQPITHELGACRLALPRTPPPVSPVALDHGMKSDGSAGACEWTYTAAFRIVPQTNDLYQLQVGFGAAAGATDRESALAALAQYDVLAPRMDSVLTALGGPVQESTRLPNLAVS